MRYTGTSLTQSLNLKSACALLVQLVERRSPKPDVGGSSPPGRAIIRESSPESAQNLLAY